MLTIKLGIIVAMDIPSKRLRVQFWFLRLSRGNEFKLRKSFHEWRCQMLPSISVTVNLIVRQVELVSIRLI